MSCFDWDRRDPVGQQGREYDFAMQNATFPRILSALTWALVIIASAYLLKGYANREWIEVGLTGLALTFVVLPGQSRHSR